MVDDPRVRRRFRAEAQASAQLSHPHILAVFDWGDTDDTFLVTEYLGGGSLRRILDEGPLLTLGQALLVGLHAAHGLAHAHEQGFVHRDIKPANLLFGADARLRIGDFGIARAVAEATWTEPEGALIGTARYAAPEQATGSSVDGRVDVYSLALTLVEAVTGTVPMVEATPLATMLGRQDSDVDVPAEMGVLRSALVPALRSDPAERCTAAQLARALSAAARDINRPEPLQLAPLPITDPDVSEPEMQPFDGASSDGLESEPSPPGPSDDTTVLVLDDDTTIQLGPLTGEQALLPHRPGPELDDDSWAGDAWADDETFFDRESLHPDAEPDTLDDLFEPDTRFDDEPVRSRRWLWLVPLLLLIPVAAYFLADRASVINEPEAPATFPVGTYVGRQLDDVRPEVAIHDWVITTAVDRQDGTEPGEIIQQTPVPGVEIEAGAGITLVISEGQTFRQVPTLIGLDKDTAIAAIQGAGLELGTIDNAVFDEEAAPGIVVSASALPGEELEVGSVVDLGVSVGPEPRVIPPLDGLSFDEAAVALTELHLIPIAAEASSETVPAGGIISIVPEVGASAPRDSEVTITISTGFPFITVPDVRGLPASEAADILAEAGLVVTDTEGPPNRDVVITIPETGESVRKGSDIRIITR